MNNTSKDDGFEVSDSTDWLETSLPSLAPVDSALRCQVCKDFYTTPMITSCSHTFCSLCIRRCLNNDGRCPACRAQDQELKLRFNGAMEDLVQAFTRARPQALELARKPTQVVGSASPKRNRDQAGLEADNNSPRKRTRSSGRRKQEPTVIEDSDGDDDYIPEDGFVMCPICDKEVKEASINAHIDRGCPDEPRASKTVTGKSSRSSAPTVVLISDKPAVRPERLPQLHYSIIKDNTLQRKLVDLGLSAAGSRQLMEKRYTEWITLWNANCDATKPKTKSDLKRELDIWERTQGGKASAPNYAKDPGAQIKDKDFDGQAWSSKHEDSFKELIANARKKRAVKEQAAESTSDSPSVRDNSETIPAPISSMGLPPGGLETVERGEDAQRLQGQSPSKPGGSQSRFFQESDAQLGDHSPRSSQYSSRIMVKDPGTAADIATN